MAKKFKDKQKEKRRSLFTNPEKKAIDDVEDYMDSEIDLQWESGVVKLDSKITDFLIDPGTGLPISFPEPTRKLMITDLYDRFLNEGWSIKVTFLNPHDPHSARGDLILTPRPGYGSYG